MQYALIICLGLIIGSFLNVCIYRIPREESISYPASHCTKCGSKLNALDLIPVFSYIFLRGRCRYCKEKISIIYPFIEILNMLLYLLIYFKYGYTLNTVKYCILISLMIVIGAIDFKTQEIYSVTTYFGVITAGIFIIIQYLLYKSDCFNLVLGGIIGFLAIYLIVFLTKGMGRGDIEVSLVCGLFLGLELVALDLFLSIVIGGIVAILVLCFKVRGLKDKMPFAPFIGLGTIISILFGNILIPFYLNLFI